MLTTRGGSEFIAPTFLALMQKDMRFGRMWFGG